MNFKYETDRIYLENEKGECTAEVTFPQIDKGKVNINHTYVTPALRGQGIADILLRELALYLRKNSLEAIPTCSYAIEWFKKNPQFNDVCKK